MTDDNATFTQPIPHPPKCGRKPDVERHNQVENLRACP